jgi:hypothetical protein
MTQEANFDGSEEKEMRKKNEDEMKHSSRIKVFKSTANCTGSKHP